jgi:hypothetical protein
MRRDVQIGVKFVGYSAYIVSNENGAEENCAMLDFVSGCVSLSVDDGFAIATSRTDLGTLVDRLPEHQAELQERSNRLSSSGHEANHTLKVSELGEVSVRPRTDMQAFVRHLAKRFRDLEQVIDQALDIGSRIVRRPYDEFIEETRETGISRIEVHGFGLVKRGHLIFHPSENTASVRR